MRRVEQLECGGFLGLFPALGLTQRRPGLRRPGQIVAPMSHDGSEWILLPALRIDMPKTVRVGVDAVSTSKRPFVVDFDELNLTTK